MMDSDHHPRYAPEVSRLVPKTICDHNASRIHFVIHLEKLSLELMVFAERIHVVDPTRMEVQ